MEVSCQRIPEKFITLSKKMGFGQSLTNVGLNVGLVVGMKVVVVGLKVGDVVGDCTWQSLTVKV